MGRRAGRKRMTRREKIEGRKTMDEGRSRVLSPMMRELAEAYAGVMERKAERDGAAGCPETVCGVIK